MKVSYLGTLRISLDQNALLPQDLKDRQSCNVGKSHALSAL